MLSSHVMQIANIQSENGQRAGDCSLLEDKESRIVFLEWKSNSDARAHREKLSDMAWKIASLENEIEFLNKDRTNLKLELVRLEVALRSAEEGMQAAQRFPRKCPECENHKNENEQSKRNISKLMEQIRVLNAEKDLLQSRALNRCAIQKSVHSLVQECTSAVTDIYHLCDSLSLSNLSTLSLAQTVHEVSVNCNKEALECFLLLQADISELYSKLRASQSNFLRMAQNYDTMRYNLQCTLQRGFAQEEFLKRQIGVYTNGIREILGDCIAAQNDCAVAHCHFQLSSRCCNDLQGIADECRRCSRSVSELYCSFECLGTEYSEVHHSHNNAMAMAYRICEYLRKAPLNKTLSLLRTDIEQLRQCVQSLHEMNACDESLSEVSTFSAEVDWSMRQGSPFCQFLTNAQFLQGLRFPRSGCASAICCGRLVFAGGTDGRTVWDTLEYFDLSTKSWGLAATMPSSRICFQLISARDRLYVIGGEDSEGRVLASCLEFDPKSDAWSNLASMHVGRTGFGAVYLPIDGMIVVAGGWNGKETIASAEIYDIELNTWFDLDSLDSDVLRDRGFSPTLSPWTASWGALACDVQRPVQNFAPLPFRVGDIDLSALKSFWHQSALEGLVSESFEKAERICSALRKEVNEQVLRIRRCVGSNQLVRRQAKAEDCFNRARIDSLKSQVFALKASEEIESKRCQMRSLQVCSSINSILEDCITFEEEISSAIQGEKKCLELWMGSNRDLLWLRNISVECQNDAEAVRSGMMYVFADLKQEISRLTDLLHQKHLVQHNVAQLQSEFLLLKGQSLMHQRGLAAVSTELINAIVAVESLRQQSMPDAQYHRALQNGLMIIGTECQTCFHELLCFREDIAAYKEWSDAKNKFDLSVAVSRRGDEQRHLNEMISLLGSEVIRRLEAEKTVETLSQHIARLLHPMQQDNDQKHEISEWKIEKSSVCLQDARSDCESSLCHSENYDTVIPEDAHIPINFFDNDPPDIATNKKMQDLKHELFSICEEKGVLEAALDLEIMANKSLRAEIADFKARDLETDVQRDDCSSQHVDENYGIDTCPEPPSSRHEEVQVLREMFAVSAVIMEYIEKYVDSFSEETVDLIEKLASAFRYLQEKKQNCENGICTSAKQAQQDAAMLLEQVQHETAVAEKRQILAQEELSLSERHAQHWREKYEAAMKAILLLEQQLRDLQSSNEQTELCNLDLRRSLALVHSNQHLAANALLWRFSHHATKGCIQDIMADHSALLTTRSDISTSSDGTGYISSGRQEAAILLSCRGSNNQKESQEAFQVDRQAFSPFRQDLDL